MARQHGRTQARFRYKGQDHAEGHVNFFVGFVLEKRKMKSDKKKKKKKKKKENEQFICEF